MLRSLFQYSLLCLILISHHSFADERIKLIVPDFKPYTYYQDGEFRGIGVEKIKKIFSHLDIEYRLSLAPNYGRAVDELRKGRAEGLFLASENEERNDIAEFSKTIMINRWSWFLPENSKLHPSQPSFKKKAEIATYLNTNTHKWLEKNSYKVSYSPSDTKALPMLLDKKRIRVVFLAELVFFESSKEQGIDPTRFVQVVEKEKPFGIYISKDYLKKHPHFMRKLNDAIEATFTHEVSLQSED